MVHAFVFVNGFGPPRLSTLSLHDALPTSDDAGACAGTRAGIARATSPSATAAADRKSRRLNSSHVATSYAVFCLEKKRIAKSRESSIAARLRAKQSARLAQLLVVGHTGDT